MDMEHEIPKKLGVLATHGDGEPPKTLDAHYVKDIMYYFDNHNSSIVPEHTNTTYRFDPIIVSLFVSSDNP